MSSSSVSGPCCDAAAGPAGRQSRLWGDCLQPAHACPGTVPRQGVQPEPAGTQGASHDRMLRLISKLCQQLRANLGPRMSVPAGKLPAATGASWVAQLMRCSPQCGQSSAASRSQCRWPCPSAALLVHHAQSNQACLVTDHPALGSAADALLSPMWAIKRCLS